MLGKWKLKNPWRVHGQPESIHSLQLERAVALIEGAREIHYRPLVVFHSLIRLLLYSELGHRQ